MSIYILDTDLLSLHQRGHEPLRTHLLKHSSEQIAISIISVEEFVRGRLAQIRKSKKAVARVKAYHWLMRTFDFLCGFRVIEYDHKAENIYQTLCNSKIRIGSQDLKIAAIVVSREAILVSRNRRDFEKVPDLELENWSLPTQQ